MDDSCEANSTLIAAAPTAIADMIAELRTLRALKARVEAAPVMSVQCDNDGPYVEVPERMIGQRVALVGLESGT